MGVKCLDKVKVVVAAEENRLEVVLGEKCCELECSERSEGGTAGCGSDEDLLQHQGGGEGGHDV